MCETISKKSYHSKNRGYILAKGMKTTYSTIEKVKRHESYNPKTSHNSEIKPFVEISQIALDLGERMNIHNNQILEPPSKILSALILDSGIKPWRMLVNSLSQYVEWIYIHSVDVAIISLMLAWELSYTDEELWNIGLGAFLHDAGKLLIPKSIIQKPGPLNDMEMVCMRRHCELGVSSVEPCCLPKECMDIVLQHHERLDGTGYPKGLKENEICQNAKIVMIADVVAAIISDRPYKLSQGIDMALKILKSEEDKYPQDIVSLLAKILK